MLPTHFSVAPMGVGSQMPPNSFDQQGLFKGEVVGIILPTDKLSRLKLVPEYDVSVQMRESSDVSASKTVRCIGLDNFGSTADYSAHYLRPTRKDSTGKVVEPGATVLISYVAGDSNLGVILGGYPQAKPYQTGPVGRFFKWIFNGVSVNINDDGETRIRVNGATKSDGTADSRDATQNGPYVQFTKDGNFYVTDNNGQSLTINPGEKSVRILAVEQAQVNAKRVHLGSQTAYQNLVLGQELVAALNAFADLLIKNPKIGANGSGPVIIDPKILQGLIQWKLTWVTNIPGPARILSAKAYTER